MEIPDCSEVDGIFPRAISYIFKEVSHRQLYEQTNITISLSIIVVSDESKGSNEAFDMLSLNPSESRSLQWNPNEEAFWPDDLVATTIASYKSLTKRIIPWLFGPRVFGNERYNNNLPASVQNKWDQ